MGNVGRPPKRSQPGWRINVSKGYPKDRMLYMRNEDQLAWRLEWKHWCKGPQHLFCARSWTGITGDTKIIEFVSLEVSFSRKLFLDTSFPPDTHSLPTKTRPRHSHKAPFSFITHNRLASGSLNGVCASESRGQVFLLLLSLFFIVASPTALNLTWHKLLNDWIKIAEYGQGLTSRMTTLQGSLARSQYWKGFFPIWKNILLWGITVHPLVVLFLMF